MTGATTTQQGLVDFDNPIRFEFDKARHDIHELSDVVAVARGVITLLGWENEYSAAIVYLPCDPDRAEKCRSAIDAWIARPKS